MPGLIALERTPDQGTHERVHTMTYTVKSHNDKTTFATIEGDSTVAIKYARKIAWKRDEIVTITWTDETGKTFRLAIEPEA